MHTYTAEFFRTIEAGAVRSAWIISDVLLRDLTIHSVLDVGCGQGAWLKVWKEQGVTDVLGIDGGYVDTLALLVGEREFVARDLEKPFVLDRSFDLVTAMEVAEHLSPSASADFVDSLTAHANMVLFSAAVPGQGGEHHINERPPRYWQDLFSRAGFRAYDVVRPELFADLRVEPWYRFNAVLYVSDTIRDSLPETVRSREVPAHGLREAGDIWWRLRKALVRPLPIPVVTGIARAKARLSAFRGDGGAS